MSTSNHAHMRSPYWLHICSEYPLFSLWFAWCPSAPYNKPLGMGASAPAPKRFSWKQEAPNTVLTVKH